MKYRKMGGTGLKVSELCLGTMQFLWLINEEESFKVLDAFVEHGGTFLDTADMYSSWVKGSKGGDAEGVMGRWMKRRGNRRNLVIATKNCARMWDGPNGEGLNRAHILQAVEDSLRRLQTDYIDLYQTHWDDKETPIEETLAAYQTLIQQGKIRYAGCSNYAAGKFAEALVLGAHKPELAPYRCYQPYYNLLHRKDFETEHVDFVKRYGVGVIPYSPLAGGFLTGKFRRNKPLPGGVRAKGTKQNYFSDRNFKILEGIDKVAKRKRKTPGQISLAWLLAHDWMTAPIVGGNNPAQIKENLGASDVVLSKDDKAELDKLSAY
jgi:aryl-alcohol dehydrogenase-like predicted oxidoreductase